MNTKSISSYLLKFLTALAILALAMAWAPARSAYAAVGVVNQWNAVAVIDTTTATSPQTGTYTVAAGTSRLLVIGVTLEYSAITAQNVSATYGGQPLTLITQYTAQRQTVWVGYLKESGIAAAANTTLSVAFNTNNLTRLVVHAATYSGVDQTNPIVASESISGDSVSTLTFTNIPTVNTGYIFYVTNRNANNTATPPAGGGYTEHFDTNYDGGGTGFRKTVASKPTTGAPESGTVTFLASPNRTVLAVVSLNPALPPTVTINQASTQLDPTNTLPINFKVVFSEPIDPATFTTADITQNGTSTGIVWSITNSGDDINFILSATSVATNGTLVPSIGINTFTDVSGMSNTAASTSTDNTVTYDISALTVTIDQASGQTDPTNTSPINFTVVFSTAITDFATGDVTLSGTAGATTATVTGSGTTYNVAVSGMTGSGTVIATIPAGVATDAAGNVSTASTSTDNTVTYDTGALTVSSSTPANNAKETKGLSQLTVTFSEDAKNDGSAGAANNIANYLLVEDGAEGVFNTVNCSGGLATGDTKITITSASYTNNSGNGPFVTTLTVNPLGVGTYRLFVCGTTSIEDPAGNELNNGLADSIVNFTINAQQRTSGNAKSTLPATGFPMNKVTLLPAQPANLLYASTDLWMEIPKLGLKTTIVGVPSKDGTWDVAWLNKNTGWLEGSAFPTWNGNSVLTAHVWDALNKPGPFAELKKLKYGDQIRIHAFGQVYIYEVRESESIAPTNISKVFKHEEKSWITLVTCEDYKELTQTYTYRRMVRAVLVHVTAEK